MFDFLRKIFKKEQKTPTSTIKARSYSSEDYINSKRRKKRKKKS